MSNTIDWARYYAPIGIAVLPIPFKTKAPVIKGWNDLVITPETVNQHFQSGVDSNIGIRLGEISQGLTDIDIDNQVALKIAPMFFPVTLKSGRLSNPDSHYWYKVISNKIEKTQQFQFESVGMILEIRSNGCQTVVPPSVHVSGEQICFSTQFQDFWSVVTNIDGEQLIKCAKLTAAATLLVIHYPSKGSRHNTLMPLIGTLFHGGWNEQQVNYFIDVIVTAAGDEEKSDRLKIVSDTANRFAESKPVSGKPKLKEIMEEKVVDKVCEWLGLNSSLALLPKPAAIINLLPWPDINQINIPDGYSLDSKGVYKENEKKSILICGPLIVESGTLGIDKQNSGKILRFLDLYNDNHQYVLRDVDLLNPETLKPLIDMAFQVISTKSNAVLEYISSFSNLPMLLNSKTTGWVEYGGESIYVLPEETISRSGIDILYLPEKQTNPKTSTKGTLDEWQLNIAALCVGNPKLIFSLGVGFSGLIIYWLACGSMVYHWFGYSSRGKTTTEQAVASIYGCGAEPGQNTNNGAPLYIETWDSTANGFELIFKKFNDLCGVMDELGMAGAKSLNSFSYRITSGGGKNTMTANRDERAKNTWRIALLSTGELAIQQKSEDDGQKVKAGQIVRVTDLPAGNTMFDDTHGYEPSDFANLLKKNSSSYYGTAFKEYVRGILNIDSNDLAIKTKLKFLLEECKTSLKQTNLTPEQNRVVERFAIPLLAIRLAKLFGIVNFSDDEINESFKTILNSWLSNSGATITDDSRAIEQIISFIQTQKSRFIDLNNSNPHIPNNLSGYIWNDGVRDFYLIFEETFRSEVLDGFDVSAVCDSLIKSGFLKREANKKTYRKNVNRQRLTFYAINADILGDSSNTEDELKEAQEILNNINSKNPFPPNAQFENPFERMI